MKKIISKKTRKEKNHQKENGLPELTPAVGGLIGAVTGAAVGTFMVKILSDKHNQKRLQSFLGQSIRLPKEINDRPYGVESVSDEVLEKPTAKNK